MTTAAVGDGGGKKKKKKRERERTMIKQACDRHCYVRARIVRMRTHEVHDIITMGQTNRHSLAAMNACVVYAVTRKKKEPSVCFRTERGKIRIE